MLMIKSETGPIIFPGRFTSINGWHNIEIVERAEARASSSGACVVSATSTINSFSRGNSSSAERIVLFVVSWFMSVSL